MEEKNLNNLSSPTRDLDQVIEEELNHSFLVSTTTSLVDDSMNNQQERPKSANRLYGKNAVAQVLVNIDFPCNKQELTMLIGHKQIEYRKGYLIKFRDAIRNCFGHEHIFNSSTEVISSVTTYLDSMGLSERVTWLAEEMRLFQNSRSDK